MLITLFLSIALEFSSPINFPVSLAGNFGEPRPNHFHGGIDIRTERVEGKPIFSVADGYVSRLTVGLDGFGNAVYVTHPNGITTVYGHLKKFVPQLQAIVKKWQYKNKKAIADVRLKPTQFPVSRGQLIAFSGNTGASQAPHLHLEFHDTRSWMFLDPLDYLKEYVSDGTPPKLHSLMVYPIKGEGVVNSLSSKQSFSFETNTLKENLEAWGKVGFSIFSNDFMEDSSGRLGVRHTMLTVDGNIIFESDVDSIPFKDNPFVNSWGDYDIYCQKRLWYLKSFIDPGNSLPILYAPKDRGIVTIDEERPYHLVYTLSDAFGNKSQYFFTILGKKSKIPKKKAPSPLNFMPYNKINFFQRPGVSLIIKPGSLPRDVELHPSYSNQRGSLSDLWSFYGSSYPLLRPARIALKLNKKVKDISKLYILSHSKTDAYHKSEYIDGWVEANVMDLGASYEVAYDDTPPEILEFSFLDGKLFIISEDKESGIEAYWGYIDGKFILFSPIDKKEGFIANLKDIGIKRMNKSHKLKFIVTDKCHNQKEYNTTFSY